MNKEHRGILTADSEARLAKSGLELLGGLRCAQCGAAVIGFISPSGLMWPKKHVIDRTTTAATSYYAPRD
jgi:hypothetical protein